MSLTTIQHPNWDIYVHLYLYVCTFKKMLSMIYMAVAVANVTWGLELSAAVDVYNMSKGTTRTFL